MKKKLWLLLISFLLCGCTMNYKLYINRDLKVEEKVLLEQPESPLKSAGLSKKDFLEAKKQSYAPLIPLKPYNMKYQEKWNKVIAKGSLKYQSIQQLSDSLFFKNLYEKLSVTEENNIIKVQTDGLYYREKVFNVMDEYVALEQVKVQIQFENEVIDCNADEKNEFLNLYTWYIAPDMETKPISFSLSKKVVYHVVILHYLQENFFTIILFASIVLVGFIIYRWIKNMEKKNNEI